MSAFSIALGSLGRRSLGTLISVVVLSYAIAANVTVIQVIETVILPSPPFPRPEQIVHLELRMAEVLQRQDRIAIIEQTRDKTWSDGLFSAAARVSDYRFDGSESVQEWGLRPKAATASLFPMLGLKAHIGRLFSDQDATEEPRPIVVSYELWRSRLGGDPAVIESVVLIPGTIGERRWRLVGVLPPGVEMPYQANLWIAAPSRFNDGVDVPTFARLAPGVGLNRVRAALPFVSVTPLKDFLRPRGAMTLAAMLAACCLLFVMACVQIGAFHYSRSLERSRDITTRIALGATRAHLLSYVAAQAILVSGCAAVVSFLLIPAVGAGLRRLLPADLTPVAAVLGERAWMVWAGASVIGAVVLTVSGWVSCAEVLRTPRLSIAHPIANRLRSRTIVIAQVGLMVAVMYLAGALVRSYLNVTLSDLGFRRDGLLAVRLPAPSLPPSLGADEHRSAAAAHASRVAATVARLGALKSVESVATSSWIPLRDDGLDRALVSADLDSASTTIPARMGVVGPGFLRTMKISQLLGDEPAPEVINSTPSSPAGTGLAVVTQSLARALSVHGPVLGQVVRNRGLRFRVVGVIGDIRTERSGWLAEPTLLVFPPKYGGAVALVQTARDSPGVAEQVRGVLREEWGPRTPAEIVHVEQEVSLAAQTYQGSMAVVVLISLSVVALAALGVSATFAADTASRSHEMAIRAAIGADPPALARLVTREAALSIGVGSILGMALGIGVTHTVRSMLVGVMFVDGATLGSVGALIAIIGWLSVKGPASVAACTDPVRLLRSP